MMAERRSTKALPRVTVCDPNPDIGMWLKSTDYFTGTFQELTPLLNGVACLANAGNGLGYMGAGIAGAIARRWPYVARQAMAKLERPRPAPVGTAFVVGTGTTGPFKYVCYTVTMEQPGTKLSKADRVAYKAMLATLKAVDEFNMTLRNPITQLVVPGFGAGIGGLSAKDVAGEIEHAIYDYGF